MQCPHCYSNIAEGATKCTQCTGNIKFGPSASRNMTWQQKLGLFVGLTLVTFLLLTWWWGTAWWMASLGIAVWISLGGLFGGPAIKA